MKTDIKLYSLANHSSITESVQTASQCPCCGVSLLPHILYGAVVEHEDETKNKVFLFNYCNYCEHCFISNHSFDTENDDGYLFDNAAPLLCFQQDFSEAISKLSPTFVAIYNESLYAEKAGLMNICGVGYRKAFEFLIKDYAIHKNPAQKDIIMDKSLGKCINEYIDKEHLLTLAKATTWLGNDETHYKKKHQEYDIEHLKKFIRAFITFVDHELAYEEALKLTSTK